MRKSTFFILLIGILLLPSALVSAQALEATDVSVAATTTATPPTTVAGTAAVTASNAYQDAKSNYQSALNNYQTARQNWIIAKNQYQSSTSAADLETALSAAKTHLLNVTDVMIKNLTTVKTTIENMENMDEALKQSFIAEIDSDISWLESKQTEINNIANKDDLIAIVHTIRTRWDEIKARVIKYIGNILAAKTDATIGKLVKAKDAVRDKINILQENGQNTTELEQLVSDYEAKIELAKTQYQNAKDRFNQISSIAESRTLFNQGKQFIEAANQYVREAWQIVQSIIDELAKKRLHYKELSGTGTIYINGGGTATLSGKGTVNGSSDATATAVVTDNGGDAVIETTGGGNKEELGNNQTKYVGFGTIAVTGNDIEVKLTGAPIDISASGTGTVTMQGTGTYTIGDEGDLVTIPAGGVKITFTEY